MGDKLDLIREHLRAAYALLAELERDRAAEQEHYEALYLLTARPTPGKLPTIQPVITSLIPPPPSEDE